MTLKPEQSKKRKSTKSKNSSYDHLAIRPVGHDVYNSEKIVNWNTVNYEGFTLPGILPAKETCGRFATTGCLNSEEHQKKGFGNKIYVHKFRLKCGDPKCIVCYQDWIVRAANRAKRRIKQHQDNTSQRAIHVVLSPHKTEHGKSEKQLRKIAMKILREVRVKDGALVLHPWRLDKKELEMYESPHFHFVGFGWFRNKRHVEEKYGWKVLYMGQRGNLFGTFSYLLNHCGVKKGRHAITWMGRLSYGQMRIQNTPEYDKCPACGRRLVAISHDGADPVVPPDEEFEGFVDCEGWHQVKTNETGNDHEPNYEYDPRTEVNEILRSLAEAN